MTPTEVAQPAVVTQGTSLSLAHRLEQFIRSLEERASDDAIANRLSAAVVRRLTVRELKQLLGDFFVEGGR